jgi:hypothetical protein
MDTLKRNQLCRARWNKKTYRELTLRVHRGSDLDDRLHEFMYSGGSVNFLIAKLLCEYFGVAVPYKREYKRTVEHFYP